MNKQKRLIYIGVIFFLIINPSYYWTKYVNFFLLLFLLLLFGFTYIYLIAKFFIRLNGAFREKFNNKSNLTAIIVVGVVLVLISLRPYGIINYDELEGENLFVANMEGVANCETYLKLKDNNKFKYTSYCFGIDEIRGVYELDGDTIFFFPKKQDYHLYNYAIIRNSNKLMMYHNESDSLRLPFTILENNLHK